MWEVFEVVQVLGSGSGWEVVQVLGSGSGGEVVQVLGLVWEVGGAPAR